MSRRLLLVFVVTTHIVNLCSISLASSSAAPIPILKSLARNGWTPDAPLDETVHPLPNAFAGSRSIHCYQVRFTSHQWHGQPVHIFGFYAAPADTNQKVPALLLVHGGGGYGTLGRVVEAAGHGFAALSIDLPGKGTGRETHSRSTGPDMTVPQIFATSPAVSDSYLYHAVLAQRRALTFLCRRPEVDPQRLGLVGASWGGATGLLTAATDPRVKCLVDIYGSGYVRGGSCWGGYFAHSLTPAQFDRWEANYDASRYLADIHVPVLGITGTADGCYWLPQFQQTMRGLHPTPRLLCLPNLDHKIDLPARAAFFRWLETQLQPRSAPLPTPPHALRVADSPQGYAVSLQAAPTAQSVAVSYVVATADGGLSRYRWTTLPCRLLPAGRWAVTLPAAPGATYLYATVAYPNGFRESLPVHTVVRRWLGHHRIALVRPTMCAASLMTPDVFRPEPIMPEGPLPFVGLALAVLGGLWLVSHRRRSPPSPQFWGNKRRTDREELTRLSANSSPVPPELGARG
jgi:dienelactone hydrolase